MTPELPQPDELLSASHDGELSASERAVVEQLLAESPAAREMLDDFRELSTLLQSLPRPRAPDALCRSVLLRLEAGRAPTRLTAPTRRRSWLLWGSSLIAAALLAAVGNWLWPRRGHLELAEGRPLSEQELLIAQNGAVPGPADASGHPPVDRFAAARFTREASDRASRLGGEAESASASVPPPPGGVAGVSAAPSPSTPLSVTEESRLRAAGSEPSLGERAADRLQFDPRSPPSVADLLAYVDRVADQTVIVEMEVVDVDRTAEDMLVLLRRRGVQVVGEIPAGAAAQAVRRAAEAEPMLVGVYVEASDQQLAEVVDELTTQVAINEATTRNADLAQTPLDDRLQKMERDYGTQRNSRNLREEANSAPASSVGDLERRRQMAISQTPQSQDRPLVMGLIAGAAPASAPPTTAPPAAPTEWSVKMNLTESLYRQLDRTSEAVDLAREGVQQAPRPPSPAPAILGQASLAARKGGGAPPSEVRRMLFVFQPARNE